MILNPRAPGNTLLSADRKDEEKLADYLDKQITAWGIAYERKHKRPASVDVVAGACLLILENTVALKPTLGDMIIDAIKRQKFKIDLIKADPDSLHKV